MSKNIVICLDGTAAEPESGQTNVARTFDMLVKDPDRQATYYDPGVGTMGARSATTRMGKLLTRIGGLAFGHGIQDNVAEAYAFLMQVYEPGDLIYLFGFSRGAYTARALAGLLRTVGLLEPGATNLVPYALKLFTGAPRPGASQKKRDKFWADVQSWNNTFGNPGFERFAKPVHFLGAWDTVKFVGWFNILGQFRQAKWPFTWNVKGVAHGRHAVSIDERRRYYAEYRFDDTELADPSRDLRELWFAGGHSDVGGGFESHELADLALMWMVDEAVSLGLLVRPPKYRKHLNSGQGQPLPPGHATGPMHLAGIAWFLLGAGWRNRKIPTGSHVHRSVQTRAGDPQLHYRPRLEDAEFVDR
jgi:uncharacterized protein (DUF2235 family)